jgi:hypothetical protein
MRVFGLAALVASHVTVFAGSGVAEVCGTTNWDLTAGQTIDVGTVTVSNDLNNVYVTYTLDDPDFPNASLGTLHVWVGNSLANMPSNNQGFPVPGQFCQGDGGACFDATGLTTYTFTIPFSETNYVDGENACGQPLYVVTHAEVDVDTTADGDNETAFGGPVAGPGERWWFYGLYTVCCELGEPPIPVCETAFAKGGWVWTTDHKSNPENLPSLNLTRNRWGWAIELLAVGDSSYDIWAGAGLNKIANGTLVGTLNVSWDGANAAVTYSMLEPSLEEVHLYAGDASPATIAPGQYGFLDQFDPNRSTYTFNVPLVDADGVPGVWLVAHAAVCSAQ